MILDSVGAVLAFLLLIVPGFVWDRLASGLVPDVTTSVLREGAQIAFASVIPSGIAAIIFYRVWLSAFSSGANPLAPIAAGLMTSALACVFVVIFSVLYWHGRKAPRRKFDPHPALYHALVRLPEKSGATSVVATVRLQDGTMWQGTYAAHDTDAEVPFRALMLKPPIFRRDAESTNTVPYGRADHVVLSLDQVSSLQLRYLSGRSKPTESTTS